MQTVIARNLNLEKQYSIISTCIQRHTIMHNFYTRIALCRMFRSLHMTTLIAQKPSHFALQLCAKGLAYGPYTVTALDEDPTSSLSSTGRPLTMNQLPIMPQRDLHAQQNLDVHKDLYRTRAVNVYPGTRLTEVRLIASSISQAGMPCAIASVLFIIVCLSHCLVSIVQGQLQCLALESRVHFCL